MNKNLIAVAVSFLLIFSCQAQEQTVPASGLPSKQVLKENFRDSGKLLIIYGTGASEYQSSYARFAKAMHEASQRFEILSKRDTAVTEDDLKNYSLFLLGTPQNNAVLRELLSELPVTLANQELKVADRTFTDGGEVLSMNFWPNPKNPTHSLSLISGMEEKEIAEAIPKEASPYWLWSLMSGYDYQVSKEGKRLLIGNYSHDATWEIDPEQQWDFSAVNQVWKETEHFRFYRIGNGFDEGRISQVPDQAEQRWQAIEAFIGKSASLAPVNYLIFSEHEDKGLMISRAEAASFDFEANEAHVLETQILKGSELAPENYLLIRHLLGEASLPVLEEGLAVRFADQWHEKGYAYWAARLYLSDNHFKGEDFFSEEIWKNESHLIRECMAAVWVDLLIDRWGKENFLKRYSRWQPGQKEKQELAAAWEVYLAKVARDQFPEGYTAPPAAEIGYPKGFNFAHEGYQVYNGYGSRRCDRSLQKAKELGSNTVSLIPYTGMGDPNKPEWLSFARGTGMENDESVIQTLFQAQQKGISVMIKPQIYLWKSWTGAISFDSQAGWDLFFDRYYRWIRHYGLLSEMYGAEFFCVGVEFAKATLEQPESWKKIIKKMRALYSGKLTYAANWGEEFENCTLWPDLDFIGLNCYYPLSNAETPNKEELRKGCKSISRKVEKVIASYKKPVFLTEIGFRSIPRPWQHPHEEPKETDQPDEEAQRKCYEVFLEGILEQDWCKGIYLWKWPADPRVWPERNKSYSPVGKPAEALIKQAFERLGD